MRLSLLSDLERSIKIESVKVCIICHGNIARSQVLHHYLAEYAGRSALKIDLFSCGTAPIDAYPDADRLLDEVQNELRKKQTKLLKKLRNYRRGIRKKPKK